jgi:hypothetical protein
MDMSGGMLNEHDANQGAQSKGEFLGMSGNSGWYLLGSAGASVMMVIVLWGVFEISLLLCLVTGVALCLLSLAYVFTLKNNRPAHYDTDFFESVLVEAGLLELSFGPRARRIRNPFRAPAPQEVEPILEKRATPRTTAPAQQRRAAVVGLVSKKAVEATGALGFETVRRKRDDDEETKVPLVVHERVQRDLEEAQHQLEELMVDREGEPCEWNR